MNQIQPAQIVPFLKRFQFQGGSLRRLRIRNNSRQSSSGELIVSVREANGKKVRLRIVLDGVEEYRFQRRPGPGLFRLKEVRIGVFDGLIYFNLDAYIDEAPALHDFRASDAFIAGRSIAWEIIPPTPKPSSA